MCVFSGRWPLFVGGFRALFGFSGVFLSRRALYGVSPHSVLSPAQAFFNPFQPFSVLKHPGAPTSSVSLSVSQPVTPPPYFAYQHLPRRSQDPSHTIIGQVITVFRTDSTRLGVISGHPVGVHGRKRWPGPPASTLFIRVLLTASYVELSPSPSPLLLTSS